MTPINSFKLALLALIVTFFMAQGCDFSIHAEQTPAPTTPITVVAQKN